MDSEHKIELYVQEMIHRILTVAHDYDHHAYLKQEFYTCASAALFMSLLMPFLEFNCTQDLKRVAVYINALVNRSTSNLSAINTIIREKLSADEQKILKLYLSRSKEELEKDSTKCLLFIYTIISALDFSQMNWREMMSDYLSHSIQKLEQFIATLESDR